MKKYLPRLRAAGIHFLISAAAVILIVAGALYFWYPGQLAWAAGLLTLLSLLIAVDLILGPALTFLVFKPGKKSLKFDLAAIASIQLAALIFGVSSIYQARPVFLAFVVDRFETVAAADLEDSMLEQADEAYRQLPRRGPRLVGVQMPTEPQEAHQMMMAEVLHGTGPALVPRYYRPYAGIVKTALARAGELSELNEFNDTDKVNSELDGLNRDPDKLRFFPLAGRDRDLTVIVSRDSGEVLRILDLRPWQS